MKTRDEFVAQRHADWEALDRLLSQGRLCRLPPAQISRAASLYRGLCSDLMRARAVGYGSDLLAYLDGLAGRAHNALHAAPPYRLAAAGDLLRRHFPATLRRRARFFALAAALFLLPGVLGFLGAARSPAFAAQVLPEEMLRAMERSYSEGFAKGRSEGSDAMMAGFYVYNNVGIAFRCFATGILFGLGSLFFLVYNGLIIGTVMGFVVQAGHGANFLTFVCGHSPFELTAIVISGGAGLQMGYALVETGGQTRWGSLRSQAREIATLVLGAAAMLCVAALVEAFWSPSSLPPPAKWAASVIFSTLVAIYLLRVGRRP